MVAFHKDTGKELWRKDYARDFGGNLVHRTMKRGEFIYTEGEVARRDGGLRPAPPGL